MWDGKVRLFNMYTRELYLGLLDYLKEFADQLEYKIKIDLEDVGEPNFINLHQQFSTGVKFTKQW